MDNRQAITAELREWLLAQVAAGHRADRVLASMQASGWEAGVALEAIREVLPDAVNDLADEALAMPDLADGAGHRITAHDRDIEVVMSVRHPRIVVLRNLLSDAECDELIALARPRLSRSETVVNRTGESEVNAARTSQGMFFSRGEGVLVSLIESRIAALLNWPIERGEGLQVLRYGVGAEYRPHFDYFDPAQAGTPPILKRGGQRVGTVLMYLNTPEAGGATTFPDAGIEVQPLRGSAVFFSYSQPSPSTRTLHGGASVLSGEKWVATKWLRAGRFE